MARWLDSRSDFLELPEKQLAGTSLYMFWFRFIPEMFSALSAAFLCNLAFRLFFRSFGCSLFSSLLGFRDLIKQNSTATATSAMAV